MRTIIGFILGTLGVAGLALSTGAFVNGHFTLIQFLIGIGLSILILVGTLDVVRN